MDLVCFTAAARAAHDGTLEVLQRAVRGAQVRAWHVVASENAATSGPCLDVCWRIRSRALQRERVTLGDLRSVTLRTRGGLDNARLEQAAKILASTRVPVGDETEVAFYRMPASQGLRAFGIVPHKVFLARTPEPASRRLERLFKEAP